MQRDLPKAANHDTREWSNGASYGKFVFSLALQETFGYLKRCQL